MMTQAGKAMCPFKFQFQPAAAGKQHLADLQSGRPEIGLESHGFAAVHKAHSKLWSQLDRLLALAGAYRQSEFSFCGHELGSFF